jgi:hypothetical protein
MLHWNGNFEGLIFPFSWELHVDFYFSMMLEGVTYFVDFISNREVICDFDLFSGYFPAAVVVIFQL